MNAYLQASLEEAHPSENNSLQVLWSVPGARRRFKQARACKWNDKRSLRACFESGRRPKTRMAESATVDGGVDRGVYWPIVLAVAWSVVLIFVARAPEAWSSLGLFMLYLLWPLSTLAAFITALVWLRDGSWRRMWSALVLPLVTFVIY